LKATGTGNITAMMERGYLEVLFKTAETALVQEFDAALARYSGVHLAALAASDARAEDRRLADSGFRVRPIFEMQRPVETETGSGTAAFTIARVQPGEMAEGRIQILTHRTEHTVWQPRWLDHPNGSVALFALVVVTADMDEAAQRFSRFTGRPAMPSRCGRTIKLDRGSIELMTAQTFTALLPEVEVPTVPFMGAYALGVRSLGDAERVMRQGGLQPRSSGGALVVTFPPALGYGAWLLAEQAAALPWAGS
jgi:hypothetical protein